LAARSRSLLGVSSCRASPNSPENTEAGTDIRTLSTLETSSASFTNSFKYDPFGRRIEKISPNATSIFVYDGDNLIETVNSSGGVVARYAQAPGIDQPMAMERGTTTSYYEQDGLNSITSLSNTSGALAQTYTYDSFGNSTNSSGSLTNFFRYTAREFDSETNLYYYRPRYYDPVSGRFLSEDPRGFAGDGPNLYAYTLNNPVGWVDPMGTNMICPWFFPWCPTGLPPDPPSPPPPGLPQGFTYNHPPPQTKPVSGEALDLANCIFLHLGAPFVITGGSECTPDGRHIPGGVLGSKHCTNQAIDIAPAGLDQKKVFCAAAQCGAKYIQDEGDHWHLQTTPGRHGGRGLLPPPCECQ
jgi:RHS repeat-associated protein